MKNNQNNALSWLDKDEYPFHGKYFPLPMWKMHYLDEWNGDPILMVHGNPGWSFEYRNIVKELSKTHRCIVPDHIGFWLSDKPYDWDYLPTHQAENLEELLDTLDLTNITLIVSDWGWPIGLSYVIKHPEKFKKIIILNTWLWSLKQDYYYRIFSAVMGGFMGRFMIKYFNIFGKLVVPKAMGNVSRLTTTIHEHYYKHLETSESRKWCYTFPKEIINSSEWLDDLWGQRETLKNIPTTIIWWMKDIAFREKELNYWIDNWHDAKVVRLKNVGHYPQEESPETIIEEVKSSQ